MSGSALTNNVSCLVKNITDNDDLDPAAHLDHVEVDLPVVARSARDESVSISLLLRRVHRRDLLAGHPGLK